MPWTIFAGGVGLSGSHLLFVDPSWRKLLPAKRYAAWQHQGYLWRNRGFRSFEDYLACFNANQRRNIRRERRSMARQGDRDSGVPGGPDPR